MTFRFYVPPPIAPLHESFKLSDDMFHHAVHVLRLRVDDELEVFDGVGHAASIRLTEVEKKSAYALVVKHHTSDLESPLSITLAQCLSSSDKMDWTIEKACELGVTRIVPLFSAKSQIKLTAERTVKKQEHWQRIITAACAQCGRNTLPVLTAVQNFNHFVQQPDSAYKLILHPSNATPLKQLAPPSANQQIIVLIGPEAGLADSELSVAQKSGYTSTLLGPRILRTESAGLAAIAAIQTLWGDF